MGTGQTAASTPETVMPGTTDGVVFTASASETKLSCGHFSPEKVLWTRFFCEERLIRLQQLNLFFAMLAPPFDAVSE